ncbi:hypothetical protein IWQ60_005579 [Tieghemiomyces parasiticus]|uniref:RRM domain-containing protein n=1 Tax=Tieghemiomyces parasiticus TaxID=78921 RepID=A0A9W8ADS0_9FUNG|nr:hypothetical protein IWQ60_005579 [Tieghemiomyces parasiticus]
MKRSNDYSNSRGNDGGGHGGHRDYTKRPRHHSQANAMSTPMYPGYGMMPMGMDPSMMGQQGYGMPMPMGMPPAPYPMVSGGNTGAAQPNGGGGGPANPTRTVYLGGVPAGVTPREILDLVSVGPVEAVRILPEKNCAFVAFLDPSTAMAMITMAGQAGLNLQGQIVRPRFGNSQPVRSNILNAVMGGASRNVFMGKLDESTTSDDILTALEPFGTIEHFNYIANKGIAFAHFTDISSAIKCIQELPRTPGWEERRISFGKDRCGNSRRSHAAGGPGSAPVGGAPGMDPSMMMGGPGGYMAPGGYDPYGAMGQGGYDQTIMAGYGMAPATGGQINRTVYLSGISQEATCEDLCNAIRGGILHQIRYLPEKHIAFVSFVDPMAAMAFHSYVNSNSVSVRNRRLRAGWGHPSALPAAVATALQTNASRNVYIGSLPEGTTPDKLREDFAGFGEIEQVNILSEKNCGFVNFTNILTAVKAVQGVKDLHPEYSDCRISYGQDRCAKPLSSYGVRQASHNAGGDRREGRDRDGGDRRSRGSYYRPGQDETSGDAHMMSNEILDAEV